jgi:hypothetical protein
MAIFMKKKRRRGYGRAEKVQTEIVTRKTQVTFKTFYTDLYHGTPGPYLYVYQQLYADAGNHIGI